ncbi:MAG: glycosyltransferase family 4 protein [Armatimonadota bacterium]|nr:glycosyltransferase family 4 protein [Armatimonadota bacterium]
MPAVAADGERPLTILSVITPARYSGAERAAVYLADALGDRGHRVVFACKRNELLLEALAERGIEARVLPISGKANLAAPLVLAWHARRVGADLIHTHLSTAGLWGSIGGHIAGIPVLASVHALNAKTCYMLADLVATCSEGVREHLLDQGMPEWKLRVLYNGVQLERFEGLPSGEQMRRELGLPPDVPVIGEVAHLSPKKGQRYLIEATAILRERYPDLICLLVGEGDDAQALRDHAQALDVGEAVRLLGYRGDAPAVMRAMDVVVLPSVAKEGLGIVLIEAGLMDRAVVGSNAPGIREVIVDGETGLLAPVADAEGLAEAIATILADPALASRMGERGGERARRMFTIERMAETAEAIYRELLDEG